MESRQAQGNRRESNRIALTLPCPWDRPRTLFVANRLTPFNYYAPITRENRCRARRILQADFDVVSRLLCPTASTSFHYQSGSIGALPSRKTRAIFLEWANRISFVDFDGCVTVPDCCCSLSCRLFSDLTPDDARIFSRLSCSVSASVRLLL